MGRKLLHRDVQLAESWDLRAYVRTINDRLRDVAEVLSYNEADVWERVVIPATSIDTIGFGSAAPDIDATLGGLLFDGTAGELVAMQFLLPASWKEGGTIEPQVHWQKTTSAAGTVAWRFHHRQVPAGGVMPGAWTTITSSTPVAETPDNDTAGEHLITSLGTISMTGYTHGHLVMALLSREPSIDTYAADARLLAVELLYERDTRGSRKPRSKV